MVWHVVCYAMLCDAMRCCAMLCDAMRCDAVRADRRPVLRALYTARVLRGRLANALDVQRAARL